MNKPSKMPWKLERNVEACFTVVPCFKFYFVIIIHQKIHKRKDQNLTLKK